VPDFLAASHRHFDDATLLNEHQRFPAADHLAGFAAECALKAILLGFLGATLGPKGIPASAVEERTVEHRHLPGLWSQVAQCAAGRNALRFAELVGGPNPFARWDIADRYSVCTHINAADVSDHLAAAARVLAIQQQAAMDGLLP